jgi:ketosteroid isomerase-like protein
MESGGFARDTGRAMSQENVEAFKRGIEAGNRRDFDAMLEELDPAVEWHPAVQEGLRGEATVFRGREEVRKGFQNLVEAFDDLRVEVSEFRDLGDELLAFGRVHAHGTESGVEIDSPLAWLVRAKNGKAIWVRTYLDPKEALEAAGLRE